MLNEKAGYFHSLLFKRLSIHTIPRLSFVHDESVERGIEIDRLIERSEPRPDPVGTGGAVGKARGERVDGVLLLDKPGGMTSNRCAADGAAAAAMRPRRDTPARSIRWPPDCCR